MYKYLEHEADVGIYAQAESWQEVFAEGARAVFNLMYDIIKLKTQSRRGGTKLKTIYIQVSAVDIESLFIEWINELLAQKDIRQMIFVDFKINEVKESGGEYKLSGKVEGIEQSRYQGEYKVEAKAATYAGLKCGRKNNEYFCQCIIDI